MRSVRSEHAVMAILMMVPLVVAFLGWPAFVRWAVGPTPSAQATPQLPGAEATSAAVARASVPTARPTAAAPATLSPPATPTPQPATPTPQAVVVAAQPTAAQTAPASTSVALPRQAEASGDPSATVQEFYALVAQHDFNEAANLWSPRMRAAYPPQENIAGRFSQTQDLTLRRAEVISDPTGDGQAVVAVDLVESTVTGPRRWVGNWYLVRGPGGWLLDQPQLQSQ